MLVPPKSRHAGTSDVAMTTAIPFRVAVPAEVAHCRLSDSDDLQQVITVVKQFVSFVFVHSFLDFKKG